MMIFLISFLNMIEVRIKSHLIIDSIEDKYDVRWCGRILDIKPKIKNNLPIFVIISSNSRTELNTANIQQIEDCAKRLTAPKGKEAITADKAYIYIKEENGDEKLMGIIKHTRIKHFVPMSDKVGWE